MAQSVAKNTFYFTAAAVGQKILAFVYFLFLARVMQPTQTGDYFLALSITTIFSTVTDLGITPVLIRDIAKYPENAVQLIRRAVWFKIPFMALATLGAIAASYALGFDPAVRHLVLLACVVMLADSISLLFYGVLRGHHALRFESLGIFIGQTCTLLFGGASLVFFPSLTLLVSALIVGSAFNMVFSSWHAVRLLGPAVLRPVWDRDMSTSLLRQALPFALSGIFVKIYSYVDSVFISKYMDAAAVGAYAVAYKFTYAFQFLPMAFVAALYPGMSTLVGKDLDRLRKLFDDAIWYTALLATPITFGLWAIAGDAIGLAGDGYGLAVPALQTLAFVLIPIFLDFPVGSLLNAANRQGTKTAVMGVTMIINIILNALLVPRFGIVGAAWAGVISFYFLFVAGMWFVPSIVPGYGFARLLKTIGPILLSGIVMGLMTFLLRPIIGFVLVVPVAAVVYVAMLALTRALRAEHVKTITEALRSKLRKPSYAEDIALHD